MPARTYFFVDDHNRPIRVGIEPKGTVSLHIVLEDGRVVPLPQLKNEPRLNGIESLQFKELQKEAEKCPLTRP